MRHQLSQLLLPTTSVALAMFSPDSLIYQIVFHRKHSNIPFQSLSFTDQLFIKYKSLFMA